MKKTVIFIACLVISACALCVGALATDAVPEKYEVSDTAYTVYTDAQYQEVILGVYEGTLPNKTIMLGCDISVTLDFYMEKPCDITIDLNGKTYTNNYRPVKAGDFDLRHEDAIIRIKNGNMVSSFCVFVFQTNSNTEYSSVDNMGQIYLENVNIDSAEEIIYNYGGYGGVLNFKNCNMKVRGNYSVNGLGNCGANKGMLYQIDGGTYDGLQIHCARPGSYIRNCTVYDRELFVDSWHAHGEGGSDVEVEFTNVVSEIKIRLNDPRVDPVLYDCTYPLVELGDNQLIVSYTSPSCEKAGTKLVYQGSATGVLDESYNAPALGHSIENIANIAYTNYFEKGFKTGYCSNCEQNVTENEATASALFVSLGFSYSKYEGAPNSIIQGFKLNSEMRSYMSEDFEFGVVAVGNEGGAEIDALSQSKAISKKLNEGYFDIKISGISSELCNKYIVFCAYLINDGRTYYLDNGQTKDAVSGHTYSDIITYNNSQNVQ